MSEQLTYNGHRFGFYEELQIRAFMEEGLSLRDAIAIHYCDFPEKVSDVLGVSYPEGGQHHRPRHIQA